METSLSILASSSVILTLLALVGWRLRPHVQLSLRRLVGLFAAGAVLALGCQWLQSMLWQVTGLSLQVQAQGPTGALLAMLLFAAPLEEAVKLFCVWLLHFRGRLHGVADTLGAALVVAGGFALAEQVVYVGAPAPGLLAVRLVLSGMAHLFFSGVWGYVMGHSSRVKWLGLSWFAAMLGHGLFDHMVLGRDASTLLLTLPVVFSMVAISWLTLRRIERQAQAMPLPLDAAWWVPSYQDLRQVLHKRERRLMLHWIVIGSFVTTGVVLACLAAAVYVGHRVGVDFAVAESADARSNGPLVLLGAAVSFAFPLAGYLVARASGSRSVLEPAMGAAGAIVAVVALLSVTAPVAVVFALAVAPVAFGLSCLGAWFGLSR